MRNQERSMIQSLYFSVVSYMEYVKGQEHLPPNDKPKTVWPHDGDYPRMFSICLTLPDGKPHAYITGYIYDDKVNISIEDTLSYANHNIKAKDMISEYKNRCNTAHYTISPYPFTTAGLPIAPSREPKGEKGSGGNPNKGKGRGKGKDKGQGGHSGSSAPVKKGIDKTQKSSSRSPQRYAESTEVAASGSASVSASASASAPPDY